MASLPLDGIFAPLEAPFLVLPLWFAPAVVKLLEMSVALGFTYLFLRAVGINRVAALVGGVIYVNAGFQVVFTNWPQARVGALIPALFWATEYALKRRRLAAALPLSIVVGAIHFEGFPAIAGYAFSAAAIYAVIRMLFETQRSRPEQVGTLMRVAFGLILGTMLAAIQLLPLAEWLPQQDLRYRGQTTSSHLPLRALVTLVVPQAYGSPVGRTYFGDEDYHPTGYARTGYVEIQSFIGAIAIALIFLAAVPVRRRGELPAAPGLRGYLWVGSVLMLILIYIGGPFLWFLQQLPFAEMNFIGRLRSVFGFFLACLAAVGMHRLLFRERLSEPSTFDWRMAVLPALVLAAGLVHAVAVAPTLRHQVRVISAILLPAALIAILVGLGTLHAVRIGRDRLVMWCIPALIAVESLSFAVPYFPRPPQSSFYPSTSAHAFLDAHLGLDRIAGAHVAMYPGTTTFYGIDSITGHTFASPEWMQLLAATDGVSLRVPTFPDLDSGIDTATSPILDRLAARYFVIRPDKPVLGVRGEREPPASARRVPGRRPILRSVQTGGLRGIGLLAGLPPASEPAPAEVFVEVLSPTGRFITGGSRRIYLTANLSYIEVPLPEPDKASPTATSDRWTVRITFGFDGPLHVGVDGAGRMILSDVRPADDDVRLVFADGVQIYERLHSLPRFRWASAVRVIPQAEERVRALAERIPGDTVVLNQSGPRPSGGAGRLTVVTPRGDHLRVIVDADDSGYLVVADALRAGWRAEMDGNPTALRPADHALAAVFVPAGTHTVDFLYEPPGWAAGKAVTAAGVVSMALIAVFALMRRRRRT